MMGKLFGPRQRGGRCRRKPVQLHFEEMESRLLLATTFTVTDTSDDVNDTGSLRYAITQSNLARPGPNTIDFFINSTGVPVIAPASPLPEITNPVVINGTSQPNSGRVEINGAGAGPGADGLTISAGSSTVQGLDIVRFSGNGIDLSSNGGDVIDSSIIGTDFGGHSDLGNSGSGVMINNAPGNVIGTSLATGNVLSGNNGAGLIISGSGATGNLVLGNYIGTDFNGSKAVANGTGVAITGAPGNTLATNLISGNITGLTISGGGATGNLVQGNHIGTDSPGTGPLGNIGSGIWIYGGASNNTIGGATLGAGNVISANDLYGILIDSTSGTGNLVQGNDIGTDATGTQVLSNSKDGVSIRTSNNTIGGTTPQAANVIAGNSGDGISIIGPDITGNLVEGNFIGTNTLGSPDLFNVGNGVNILDASNNTIGGTTDGARNVISGNDKDGVVIAHLASGNLVQGNYIGTDVNGTAALPNLFDGVDIDDQASNNLIGGTAPGAGNVISANGFDGILIAVNSAGNLVQANYIGTDRSGIQPMPNLNDGVSLDNSSENTIGGTTPGAGNVISANHNQGVAFFVANSNIVQGNFIGTDRTGTQTNLKNLGNGVLLDKSSNDTIGGTTTGAGNIIGTNNLNGILFLDESTANLVQGNSIGTDFSGTQILSNSGDGVNINGATGNTIGGTAASARNIIAGNGGDGIRITSTLSTVSTGNLVQGNYIGTDGSGTVKLANLGNGVEITNLSSNNTIGGTTDGARNVISSNNGLGVLIAFGQEPGAGNLVQGNYIGTDQSGTRPLGNLRGGVSILSGGSDNTIGGMIAAARNVIAGNLGEGISIEGTGRRPNTVDNLVQGNYIGTDFTGTQPLGNVRNGIFVSDAPDNHIGGTLTGAGNVISGNGQDGS